MRRTTSIITLASTVTPLIENTAILKIHSIGRTEGTDLILERVFFKPMGLA